MTERSKRRAAEMAVIDAAYRVRGWKDSDSRTTDSWWTRVEKLDRAVEEHAALAMAEPSAARANNGAPETAQAAAAWMRERAGSLSGLVFREILSAHRVGARGLTTDAVEARLKRSHQSISPRVTELRDLGYIVDSGTRRRTRSGRWAIVYTPTDVALSGASQVESWSW